MLGLRLISEPDVEPITLADAKAQCRVTHSAEDELLHGYIRAARQSCETYQLRAWLTQTWELTLDGFPAPTPRNPAAAIRLPRPPLQAVVSVIYLAEDGSEVTMDPGDYRVTTGVEPGIVAPASPPHWPAVVKRPGAVRIRYVAGYERPLQVPENWRQAVRFEVGHYYQNRSSVEVGVSASPMLRATEALLAPDRIRPATFEL